MDFVYLAYLLYLFAALRAASLLISRRNEAVLRKICAKEFGARNSRALIIAHIVFYVACMAEACWNQQFLQGWQGTTGLFMYAFAITMLYLVIVTLGKVWTMKLFIGPEWYHAVNHNGLFKWVRHPNYYLNIIPELVGLALICHAGITTLLIFPVYAVLLRRRIVLEEQVMSAHFDNY